MTPNSCLGDLCQRAGIEIPDEIKNITIAGLTADSRRVKSGYMFVAISGRSSFVKANVIDALARGAAVIVAAPADALDLPVPTILLKSPREQAARLFYAWNFVSDRPPRLIGITGTNGKTTTASMIYHVFNSCGRATGMIGTLGAYAPTGEGYDVLPYDSRANMTTPDPEELYAILRRMKDDGAEYAVMEVSSHALVSGRVTPLEFDIGIFTNLTPEHLDMHGDVESYYLAKKSLFDKVKTAIINADDKYGRRILSECDAPARKIACHRDKRRGYYDCLGEFGTFADCAAAEQTVQLADGGYEYLLVTPQTRMRVRSRMAGRYNVTNSMQAALAAIVIGLSPSDVRRAFESFWGVRGRLERVDIPATLGFSVYIDYAHTPDALENLLVTARQLRRSGGRIILLFGCGGDRDRHKRREMAHIASRMADVTVITSDNSRSENPEDIIADILRGIDKESVYVTIPDRAEAIRYAVRSARSGDVVLLAGKGHEQYEIDKNGRRPFSEQDTVKKAIDDLMAGGAE